MEQNVRRVVLVGTGLVGTSFAYSLLNQGGVKELVLINRTREKAVGEASDLSHGLPFSPYRMKIWAGDYSDCQSADIVLIAAGSGRMPGGDRLSLLQRNAEMVKNIVRQVMDSGFDGIILMASNPVDLLTYIAWKESGLPASRVIGSGTTLDTARFRYEIGNYLNVDPRDINGYIIGEHGDSEFAVWSHTTLGVTPISEIVGRHPEFKFSDLEQIFQNVRQAGYEIISQKGATYYGIGMALAKIVRAILNDENSLLPVSVYLNGHYGHHDVFIGFPALLNKNGVRKVIEMNLNEEERAKLDASVGVLKSYITKM
ncbi:MAG: L-lactate dehydrogenase [Turicibacter sp.]|nr:L-lactate dehydrogenase [Turicibacter sp.]